MKRVFSGVQPTGNIHLGNYLGALKQFVELQKDYQCVYCIVDMHAITLPQDPKELKEHILDVAALYLAVGVDPQKSIVFVQSDVPGHAELSWILTCSSYMGELSRMTQFKDKSKNRDGESIPTGLFMYPVLMAADILLYDTDLVPVGNDQKQHIEICRDLAGRINGKYPGTFVMPEGYFPKAGARIMALDDPTKKMSKSAENIHSRISLLDEPAKIKKSIMKATTDSDGCVRFDIENKPGVSNLMAIYSTITGRTMEEIEAEFAGKGYGDFKPAVAEAVIEELRPIQERYQQLIGDKAYLEQCYRDNAPKAEHIARKTLQKVMKKIGYLA